ncbi:hypothetical protein [Streptomyces rimosus]|uniref:hypothetical protein n=1 Tax=Streptomyces rimosus TaxID=1927 RepID=UPI0004CBC2BA|nr:hypothetical protein [Streptomyces rimosus]
MPTAETSPRDTTGRVQQQLVKDREVAEKEAAKSQLRDAQVAEAARAEPVDLAAPQVVEVEESPVVVSEKLYEMRVTEDLEDVTIGYGNVYNFEAGRTYKNVPGLVYNHLREKGYVWGA